MEAAELGGFLFPIRFHSLSSFSRSHGLKVIYALMTPTCTSQPGPLPRIPGSRISQLSQYLHWDTQMGISRSRTQLQTLTPMVDDYRTGSQ